MKYNLYVVLDAKAGFYGMPWAEQRDEAAIRQFADAVNDGSNPGNMWHKHPEDFSLYRIGTYDNERGVLVTVTPEALVTASALTNLAFTSRGDVVLPADVKNGISPTERAISGDGKIS